MNTNSSNMGGFKVEVELPELERIILSLQDQLDRTDKISCSFYSKLDKFRSEPETVKNGDDFPMKAPEGIIEKLQYIIDDFRQKNNSLENSLDKLQKLVG